MPWSWKEHSALHRAPSRSAPPTPRKLRVATVGAVAEVFLVATTLGPGALSLGPFWYGAPPEEFRRIAYANPRPAAGRERWIDNDPRHGPKGRADQRPCLGQRLNRGSPAWLA